MSIKSSRIKIIVMDVDGTLTDGQIYMGEHGELMKAFDSKDGYAIKVLLPQYNIEPIVITGRKSSIVENRCRELGIEKVYQNCTDKKEVLLRIIEETGLKIENNKASGIAFIGDDNPDIPGMELSEYIGCPSDASRDVKCIADYVCQSKGGHGAVREFVEWILINENNE